MEWNKQKKRRRRCSFAYSSVAYSLFFPKFVSFRDDITNQNRTSSKTTNSQGARRRRKRTRQLHKPYKLLKQPDLFWNILYKENWSSCIVSGGVGTYVGTDFILLLLVNITHDQGLKDFFNTTFLMMMRKRRRWIMREPHQVSQSIHDIIHLTRKHTKLGSTTYD